MIMPSARAIEAGFIPFNATLFALNSDVEVTVIIPEVPEAYAPQGRRWANAAFLGLGQDIALNQPLAIIFRAFIVVFMAKCADVLEPITLMLEC